MTTSTSRKCLMALAASSITFAYSLSASADDAVATFATGAYATGLRTKEMENMIDTNGDGTVSRPEWDAYQDR